MKNIGKIGIVIMAITFCSCIKSGVEEKGVNPSLGQRNIYENNMTAIKENQGYYVIKNGSGDYINDLEISKVLELKVDGNDGVIVNMITHTDPTREYEQRYGELYAEQHALDYDGDKFFYTETGYYEQVIALDIGDGPEGDINIVRNGYRYEKIESRQEESLNAIKRSQGYYIPMRYGNPYVYDTGFDEILELTVDKNEVVVNQIDFVNSEKIIEDTHVLEYNGTKYANGDIAFDYAHTVLPTDTGEQAVEYIRFVRWDYIYVKIDYEADGLPALIRTLSTDFRKSFAGEYVFESVETTEGTERKHLEGIETINGAVIYVMYDQNEKKLLSKTNMPQPLEGLDRKDIKINVNGFFSGADDPYTEKLWNYFFTDGGITLKYWDTSDWPNDVLIHEIKFVKKPALWESPNLNGNGDEIERLDVKGRIWTIRKLEQELSVNTREGNPLVNVREFPGVTERVLFQLDNGAAVETLAITKESETIDGFDSEWVKVRTREGYAGWMFGAYTEVKDRDGPKFLTPENIDNWQQEHGIRQFSGIE